MVLFKEGVDSKKMVNGFRKLVAIVKQPVVFGIHHFGNGDFNTQIPLMLEAVIAGIYLFPKCFQVSLIFQIAEAFYGTLFRGSVWIT